MPGLGMGFGVVTYCLGRDTLGRRPTLQQTHMVMSSEAPACQGSRQGTASGPKKAPGYTTKKNRQMASTLYGVTRNPKASPGNVLQCLCRASPALEAVDGEAVALA